MKLSFKEREPERKYFLGLFYHKKHPKNPRKFKAPALVFFKLTTIEGKSLKKH
ncbi:MAG: hypothetical protein MRERV_7c007 [Mycoplasmataceae bacterium RV_VA103A]|nr:MAG: hypothetical protein MRERV_7c007 [Mycoplasmataceae bacterium RV_VA103A]